MNTDTPQTLPGDLPGLATTSYVETASRIWTEIGSFASVWWPHGLTLLAAAGVLWVLWRKRRLPRWRFNDPVSWSRALIRSLRYLTTRREWRYGVPWSVVLGEAGSGKSSLIRSVRSGRRTRLLLKEAHLAVANTEWAFFDGGVVIDLQDAPERSWDAALARWRSVLDDIHAQRPERPLDAVVLTLSARTLLSPPADGLQALAEHNYQRLFELQKRLRFTLPVYVLITRCDTVEGFPAYWRAQDAQRRREMFGWSNPFSLRHRFDPDWVDQAFSEIGAELRNAQLEAAARREIEDPDPFFLFPQRFSALRAPLRTVLERIFQPSGHHEDFFVRGIYCSGRVDADPSPADAAVSDVCFVEDLFNQRVFGERNLAVPTTQGMWSRNRLLRRAQIGLLLGGVLLAFLLSLAGIHLSTQVENSISGFNAVSHPDRLLVTEGPCNAGRVDAIYELLTNLSRVDNDWTYPLIPLSWFDRRPSEVTSETIAQEVFHEIIFPSLRCRLETRAWTLVTEPKQDHGPYSAIASVEIGQAADHVEAYLREVRNLKQARADYEFIAHSSSGNSRNLRMEMLRRLSDLAEYAYGRPLPASVLRNDGMQSSGLGQVRDSTPLQLPSQFQQRVAVVLKRRLTIAHAHILRAIGTGPQVAAEINSESHLVHDPGKLVAWLNYVETDWLSADRENNPCARIYNQSKVLLDELSQRYGFDNTLLDGFERFRASSRGPGICFSEALERIRATRITPYGSVAVRDPDAGFQDSGLKLAAWVDAERKGLTALARLSFAEAETAAEFTCQAPLSGWDGGRITEATAYAHEYQQFRERFQLPTPQQVERDKKPLFDRMARRKLRAVLDDRMTRAQTPVTLASTADTWLSPLSTGDERLGGRSRTFALTGPKINLLLDLYEQFDMPIQRIYGCARDFARGELDAANRLAEAANLYEPTLNTFAVGATGDQLTPYFDLGTAANVKEYLKQQLERAQVLAGYASPFVRFLQNTRQATVSRGDGRNGARFWLTTINEINRYVQSKDPNGQVAKLQNLLEKELRVMDQGNCGESLAKQPAETDAGLFGARYQGLLNQAGDYCHSGNVHLARDDYRRLAKRFNAELAGLFPFGPSGSPDASLATAKRFFVDYEDQRQELRAQIQGIGKHRRQGIENFLDQLDAASDFFKASLAAGPQSRPLGVDVAFRYLPASADSLTRAIDGSSQLIEWRFESGDAEARYPHGNTAVNWQFGQKVDLYLKWAGLSSYRPDQKRTMTGLEIQGPEVHFGAAGPWALLRLIAAHRDDDANVADPLNDHRVITTFSVPLKFIRPASNDKQAQAQLRLALDLLASDPKGQPGAQIALPTQFPRKAPKIW